MSFSNNSSINNVSSYLNKDEDTSNYSIKEINSIIERAKREFENPLITGYSIQKVEED